MPDPTYIALDLGTTSLKGAVVDPQRLRLEHIQQVPFPEPLAGLPPLFCEIDPGQVIAGVRRLLSQLLPHAPHCAGLLVCGQTGGLVLTDDHGAPLSNYISWRDQRLLMRPAAGGDTYYEQMSGRLSPEARRQLGHEVRPGTLLSFLFWLAAERQLPRGAIAAGLGDFVLAHLCGAPPAVERTCVPGTLNLDAIAPRGDWHHGVFASLGLEQVRWPALCDVREPVGRLEIAGQSLPCYAPVGDQQCALAGAFIAEHELSLNISTGSQASRLTPRLALGDYQTRPYFDGHFLNTITHIPAGRALNGLLALLDELPAAQGRPLDDPWPYLQQAAAAVTATDLEVDLAFFPSPVGERGAITNIHTANLTLGHLFHAALRNMADNYHACALRLSPAQDWHTLVFSGGLAQKLDLLRQMIMTRFDCPVRVSATTEDTLVGLLALSLVVSARSPTVQAATAMLRPHALTLTGGSP